MNVIFIPFGEQRANGAVDLACRKRGQFGSSAFTFYKATRNLTGGILFFFVIYRKREKINAFPGLFGDRGGNQYNRVTVPHQSCAIGLFGYLPDFNHQGSTCYFCCISIDDFLFLLSNMPSI